jgi:aryl-alcohol dehydrogenase-like predicted oxidoreductase
VQSGKVRYVGCSNYAGWQLMKALGVADRRGYACYVSQQIHYSLQARDAAALAWLIGRPAVTSLIVGARTDDQFADDLGAADLVLSGEERQRLDAVSQQPLRNPHWHQRNTAGDRLGPADLAHLAPYLAE